MGLGSDVIDIVGRLKQEGYIRSGAVVEIGAQQLSSGFLEARDALDGLARLFGIQAPPLSAEAAPTKMAHGDLKHLAEDAPPARAFWTWLNFSYSAIDVDGSPDSVALDLNYDSVPRDLVGKFDIVTNFGTTEHVANQLNAFKIIHELARPGSVMIHHLPTQGMINHGLINYNPKFFWMLARSNGYSVIYANLAGSGVSYPLPENIVDFVAPFEPSIASRRENFGHADLGLVVVMRKDFDSPFVAPLDLPSGSSPANKVMASRYWSLFEPHPFLQYRLARPLGLGQILAARLLKLARHYTVSGG